eukprot:8289921-Pyramimonas_sp.AAC.1
MHNLGSRSQGRQQVEYLLRDPRPLPHLDIKADRRLLKVPSLLFDLEQLGLEVFEVVTREAGGEWTLSQSSQDGLRAVIDLRVPMRLQNIKC